jgi:hypothetical protein
MRSLTPAQAAKLAHLATGGSLPRSEVGAKLLKPLQDAHVVKLEKSGASYVVRGVPDALSRFVEHHWGVKDLSRFATLTPEKRDRETLALIAADSKALPNSPFDGIFLRSFGSCYIDDQPLGVCPQGTMRFIGIQQVPSLRIHSKALIGIENVRCLLRFEKVAGWFPNLKELDFTLVLRWRWGAPWRRWLRKWPGQFLYLPDYDPSGISIFISEILPFFSSARLLCPPELDSLMRFGDRDRFVKQEALLRLIDARNQADITHVVSLIRKHRKSFEQETLIQIEPDAHYGCR